MSRSLWHDGISLNLLAALLLSISSHHVESLQTESQASQHGADCQLSADKVKILHPRPGSHINGSVLVKICNPYHDGHHGLLMPSLTVYGETVKLGVLVDGREFDLEGHILSLGGGSARDGDGQGAGCGGARWSWGRELCFRLLLDGGPHEVTVEVKRFGTLAYRVSSSFTVGEGAEKEEEKEEEAAAVELVARTCRHQRHLHSMAEGGQLTVASMKYNSSSFFELVACSLLIPTLVLVMPMQVQEQDEKSYQTFLKVANTSRSMKLLLSFAVLEGVEVRLQEMKWMEDDEPVVLSLYSVNDEIEGMQLYVARDLQERSLTSLVHHFASTYIPFKSSLHVRRYLRHPWCSSPAVPQEELRMSRRCLHGAIIELSPSLPPPRSIPANLFSRYTMEGEVRIYYADSYRYEQSNFSGRCFLSQDGTRKLFTCRPLTYSKLDIEALVGKVFNYKTSYYGDTDIFVYQALNLLQGLSGKHVVVLGSVEPWYEAMCLAHGADSCTTIDYNRVFYDHPKLQSLTVEEYEKSQQTFDVAFAISTFEHDGLGRYGDLLDPDADIKSMKRMKAVLKKNGILLLAVPVGQDTVRWNMHRIYGESRLPLLLKGYTCSALSDMLCSW